MNDIIEKFKQKIVEATASQTTVEMNHAQAHKWSILFKMDVKVNRISC